MKEEMKEMVQTLEAIKGGGGSMKVGTTGTISALVSKELDCVKPSLKTPAGPIKKKPPSICSFVAGAATSPKRMRPKTSSSLNETISGNDSNSPEAARKVKNYTRKTHEIPILESGHLSVDETTTPVRVNGVRRGSRIVEIVDLKCGNREKQWPTLKKFSFSKLSGTAV
ncbi:unnamed protein product [Cuscuta epithymum]|uniref:Uncharacterized protein n=1 Tax=Cuscuta epithymum TaxID=186058 RepID=A0AAV0FGV4_9ASTE|nr:unnamed protein product [Cuscuta epithymum]